ncbi:MAG: NADH:flavin oxidoreductase [candidate division NC10 bacterium]|nr:NADH:flavin oxidoreductase [candidate division NC10 bacterium]
MNAAKEAAYPLLFGPVQIAGLALRNRLVMAPTAINFAHPDGTPSDRQIEYYRMRAEGGVGLAVVEATFVRDDGRSFPASLGLHRDPQVPRFRKLAESIKDQGAKAGIQLVHAGRRADPNITGAQPIGPSPIPCPIRQVVPRELKEEEIPDLIQAFADAAERARESGFDLVCLHMAHGTLLHQFLTPLANQRQDRYGGDLEGRLRLPLEVVRAIRIRLGSSIALSCRISSEDGVEGGLRIEETSEMAKRLKEAGADLLDVSFGIQGSTPLTSPTQETPAGCFIPFAEKIRQATHAPVIAVGKIWDPALAEETIAQGKADLIALSRPLLADPDLPRKWQEKKLAQVRGCLADNKGCLGRLYQNLKVHCSVNPSLGR